jgi:bacterioferritin
MAVAWTVKSRWFAAETHSPIPFDEAMNADPRTLGWLNRALNHELSAVQQYQAQSVLARIWGQAPLSEQLQREVVEELRHAQRLMEHLIVLGVAPNAGNLLPARLGRTVDQLLLANQQMELEAVRLYQEALIHANRVRDRDFADLIQSILADEKAHLMSLNQTIEERYNHV